MKVIYDHQIFYNQRYGGVSRYFCELSSRLKCNSDFDISIIAPFHNNQYLSTSVPFNFKTFYLPYELRGSYRIQGVGRMLLPLLYRLNANANIVHETYYSLIPIGKAQCRVVTVHDMIHELFADDFSANELIISHAKLAAITRADHIICVSESTRQAMIRIFNVDAHKTSVVHHGYSTLNANINISTAKLSSGRPYIMFVANRSKYKNFGKLCIAFSSSCFLKNNFDLVAFGGGEFSENEKALFSQLGISNKVYQVSGDDLLLAQYYTGATLFVYPSLYEGFGFPPLEAMSFGCPVACSNTSSIPEVVGNAGAYFDPSDVDSMRKVIENLISDDAQKIQLTGLGYKRLEKFSWDKCAAETARIYKSLL